MTLDEIEGLIRDVPDFPKPGIVFKDITPLLADADGLKAVIDLFVDRYREAEISAVAGIESRGFIFGAAVAAALGVGFVLVRKAGKLPHDVVGVEYDLEYGTDRVEIHADAVALGHHVLIIDDLLATGGTAAAAVELIEKIGGHVHEVACLIELDFLGGREKLGETPFHSWIHVTG